MAERQEFFLYGGGLYLEHSNGIPLLIDGEPAVQGLVDHNRAGGWYITLRNEQGGGITYPLERVVGTREDVSKFQIEYRRKAEELRRRWR